MMVVSSEYHLFILWEKGRGAQNKILSDLRENFLVRNLIEITWSSKNCSRNFSRFYGEHLPSNSEKEVECGKGPFLLVVVEDKAPKYEERDTNRGREVVNINMFDAKMRYRTWTGGGHKIHATNSETESNHDITMLFGLNMQDFCDSYLPNPEDIIKINKDVIGANGWNSLKQLFYVLNNTTKYCVLRNFEMLPHSYMFDLHGDIDLLVENRNEARWIINATPIYREEYRVFHKVNVDGTDVYIDIRYLGDDYYDIKWEKQILSFSRVLSNGVSVPCDEDYFYSLLYHAYIHKYVISNDYVDIFNTLSKKLMINYSEVDVDSIRLLDEYMEKHQFEYIRPYDKSVRYNEENVSLSTYACRFGACIRRLDFCLDGEMYMSKVYRKEMSYVKKGSENLIKNEYHYLQLLQSTNITSHLLHPLKQDQNEFYFEISKIEGIDPVTFFQDRRNNTYRMVYSFIFEVWKALMHLHENRIIHRDFLASNILVLKQDGKCNVKIIDFGWSINYKQRANCAHPSGLAYDDEGYNYNSPSGSSDFYALSVLLRKIWGNKLRTIKVLSKLLSTFSGDDYDDIALLDKKILSVTQIIQRGFGINDLIKLFLIRHPEMDKCYKKIKNKFKNE